MLWLIKIITNKKLKETEQRYRLALINSNKILIMEIRKLNLMMKSISKEEVEKNCFLKSIYLSNLDKMIFVLEIINQTTNLLWVSRKKVDELKKFTINVRKTLNIFINASGIGGADFFNSQIDRNSIFARTKTEINLNNFDFSLEKFEPKFVNKANFV